jgi:squalene synthase HpnC
MGLRDTPVATAAIERDRLASAENFTVASRLLPRRQREHLMALYGFARLADDIGDESTGDRRAELDWLEGELDRAFAGTATHPVLVRLEPTIQACRLDRQPFVDLIEANRRDQWCTSYATWDELLQYCTLSANPVGRLVLAVFDADTARRVAWSDDVCSGLQIVEHLQDVGEDAGRGRTYLPADELVRADVEPGALLAPAAGPALRAVVARIAARARDLLASGAPLARSLRGRPRWAVAGFTAGGLATLDAIAAADHDVLTGAPVRPVKRTALRHAVAIAAGRRSEPTSVSDLTPKLAQNHHGGGQL